MNAWPASGVRRSQSYHPSGVCLAFTGMALLWIIYFEKIRVFKAGFSLNTLAWNNEIGLRVRFVGY